MQGLALELFSRKATAVATNVPGPQQPLYLAGCALREMMFWVPQTGSIGIGISILSYNGRVHFGLIADGKLIPDPDAVIRRFGAEFDKLLYLALMANWDATLDAAARRCLAPCWKLNADAARHSPPTLACLAWRRHSAPTSRKDRTNDEDPHQARARCRRDDRHARRLRHHQRWQLRRPAAAEPTQSSPDMSNDRTKKGALIGAVRRRRGRPAQRR